MNEQQSSPLDLAACAWTHREAVHMLGKCSDLSNFDKFRTPPDEPGAHRCADIMTRHRPERDIIDITPAEDAARFRKAFAGAELALVGFGHSTWER